MAIVAIEWYRVEMKLGLGPQYEVVTRVMIAFTGTNFFTHIFGCFLMTLNRFMAVSFPGAHDKCWSTRVLFATLLVDIIISFGIHADLFSNPFIYENINNRWVLLTRERSISEIRMITAIVVIIYEILTVILIARTLYVIKKVAPMVRKYRKEIGLVIVIAIDCILGFFECIHEASYLFGFTNPLNVFIKEHYAQLFFLIIAMNSYSVIFLSSDLRHEAVRFFRKKLGMLRVAGAKSSPPQIFVSRVT